AHETHRDAPLLQPGRDEVELRGRDEDPDVTPGDERRLVEVGDQWDEPVELGVVAIEGQEARTKTVPQRCRSELAPTNLLVQVEHDLVTRHRERRLEDLGRVAVVDPEDARPTAHLHTGRTERVA